MSMYMHVLEHRFFPPRALKVLVTEKTIDEVLDIHSQVYQCSPDTFLCKTYEFDVCHLILYEQAVQNLPESYDPIFKATTIDKLDIIMQSLKEICDMMLSMHVDDEDDTQETFDVKDNGITNETVDKDVTECSSVYSFTSIEVELSNEFDENDTQQNEAEEVVKNTTEDVSVTQEDSNSDVDLTSQPVLSNILMAKAFSGLEPVEPVEPHVTYNPFLTELSPWDSFDQLDPYYRKERKQHSSKTPTLQTTTWLLCFESSCSTGFLFYERSAFEKLFPECLIHLSLTVQDDNMLREMISLRLQDESVFELQTSRVKIMIDTLTQLIDEDLTQKDRQVRYDGRQPLFGCPAGAVWSIPQSVTRSAPFALSDTGVRPFESYTGCIEDKRLLIVQEYLQSRVKKCDGKVLLSSKLFNDFSNWCVHRYSNDTLKKFNRNIFTPLVKQLGYSTKRTKQGIVWLDMNLSL